MENLVVTLDTAKKLKATGFPQETTAWGWSDKSEFVKGYQLVFSPGKEWSYTAPTAQEIADQLTGHVTVTKKKEGGYTASTHTGLNIESAKADTMAEALAALWLKLQEAA